MRAASGPVSFCLAGLITAAAGAGVLDDTTIRDAVAAWLADATAAEATYGHISSWDTSQVTDIAQLFQNSNFDDDINAWDTSAVTNMFATFGSAKQFNQPLNDWDVSGVTSMVSMFAHAESFNQPLNNWDVSRVTSLESMFYYAYAFDQDLGSWCLAEDAAFSSDSHQGTACSLLRCGIHFRAGGTCAPTPAPTPIQTSAAGVADVYLGILAGGALLLL
ncbi:unnamed protein product [Pelagomonas calceolata]|uniref:BspA family leucine-rich repeat surface protein n=1 Tax=Pelagomonas calceolata TaxID=35677 RepID=A0A8J2WTQ0_9STRA|nr:unnamed protein product [Pelagomonas calceolata]